MIQLYVPKPEDLWFRQKLLGDPESMSYNRGYELDIPTYHKDTGCIDFPKEAWEGWYSRWVGAEPERFYAYLRDGDFLGEVNLYETDGPGVYEMGIVLHSSQRGKGYARAGMALLLDHAFGEMGAGEVTNRFERTREAALKVHQDAGFQVTGEEGGVLRLSLKRENWLSRTTASV